MQIFDAIILGTIQGIAEFFPVSSTAHVAVISKLCSFNNCGKTFDVMLNLGTLLAIMAYFYRECLQLIRGGIDLLRFRDSTDKQFFLTIFFANVPVIVIFGIAELIKFEINSWVITGINLIVFGIILYF